MRTPLILALACLAAPAAALAQVSHSRAAITGPVVVPNEPPYVVPAEPYPAVCSDLQSRRAVLADEKVTYDHQRDQLDAEAAQLAEEFRNLDSHDAAAVAAYNARSDEHNRRVAEHNRDVADMNDAVARLTGDLANATPYCRLAWGDYRY